MSAPRGSDARTHRSQTARRATMEARARKTTRARGGLWQRGSRGLPQRRRLRERLRDLLVCARLYGRELRDCGFGISHREDFGFPVALFGRGVRWPLRRWLGRWRWRRRFGVRFGRGFLGRL